MRVVIAGSRTATEAQVFEALKRCPWTGFVTAVISGTARGADHFGEQWAELEGLEVIRFPADWEQYGKRAGAMRNKVMADNADGLIAVWDGVSRGTMNMIDLARRAQLRVFVLRTDKGYVEDHAAAGAQGERWYAAEERAAIKEYTAGMSRAAAERSSGLEQLPSSAV